MSMRLRRRRPSKWATIPEPPAGARYRGYLRYSERDLYNAADKSTFALQRAEIDAYAKVRGWICAGWDEEPAVSGAADDIALRPAFQKHLADAAAGAFDVSLCFMTDRWARDTAIGLESLKRLRRAGVYWATSDDRWDINKVIEDGFSVAFVVDQEINASYARKSSQKAILARRVRAQAGYHHGRIVWGYQRPTPPVPPPHAPWNWRPPRMAAEPHPVNFARLVQLGEWTAAGLSDREIAERATRAGWILEHPHKHGAASTWGTPFLSHLLTGPFPREYAPGSGRGTILTADGERVEGQHKAAWSWDLWHRMDEARALNRKGTRGRIQSHGLERLFSGLAVCASCGKPPHHQLRHSPVGGYYSVYLCQSTVRGYACNVRKSATIKTGRWGTRGYAGARSRVLEEAFAAAVLDWELRPGWREQIAADVNREESSQQLADAATWRTNLQEERKRVPTQHRYGRIADEEMLEETARIDTLLVALPTPEGRAVERQAKLSAADTLAHMRDYWDHATPEQRGEALRTILQPYGLVVDVATSTITRFKPRPAIVPTLRIVLAGRLPAAEGGWLTHV